MKRYFEFMSPEDFDVIRNACEVEASVTLNGCKETFVVHFNDDPGNDSEYCLSAYTHWDNQWSNLRVFASYQDALAGLFIQLYENTEDEDAPKPNTASRVREFAGSIIQIAEG